MASGSKGLTVIRVVPLVNLRKVMSKKDTKDLKENRGQSPRALPRTSTPLSPLSPLGHCTPPRHAASKKTASRKSDRQISPPKKKKATAKKSRPAKTVKRKRMAEKARAEEDDFEQTLFVNPELSFCEHIKQGLIDGYHPDSARNSRGGTVLQLAVILGFESAVRILVDAGADPMLTNYAGEDAIELAMNRGNHQIADLLIAALINT